MYSYIAFSAKIIAAVFVVWLLCFLWLKAGASAARRREEEAAREEYARRIKGAEKKREKAAAQKEARAQRAAEAAQRAEDAERRKAEKHAAAMQRAEERHAQRLRHAQELAAIAPPKSAQDAPEEAQAQQTEEAPKDAQSAQQAEEAPKDAQSAQQAAAITPEAFAAQHASQTPRKASGAFAGQIVAFTGRLYGLPRAEAIKAVQARGGRAFAGMPAGTTLLVVGTLKEKLGGFLVKLAAGKLKPAKQRGSAHRAHDDAVFDFHIANFPGGK